MRSRIGIFLVGLSLTAAASASAQNNITLTQPFAPNAGAVTAFGYYMSPYSGTVNGGTERLNCVDFFHDVYVGDQWTATITNLGQAATQLSLLAATRDGHSGGYASLSYVLQLYEEAAWLTDQYTKNPASDPNRTVAIQTAIWSIVDNGPTNPSSLQYASVHDYWNNGATSNIVKNGTGSTGYWIDRAQTEYKLQSDTYYDKFNVITGTNHVGVDKQEFIYATPEPGTFVLFGSGIFAMSGVAWVRRRRRTAGLARR